jgi:Asparaginase
MAAVRVLREGEETEETQRQERKRRHGFESGSEDTFSEKGEEELRLARQLRCADAAAAAVAVLEDCPLTNAGVGAERRDCGGIQLDASCVSASSPFPSLLTSQAPPLCGSVSAAAPGPGSLDRLMVVRNPVRVATLLARDFATTPPLHGGRIRPTALSGAGVVSWCAQREREQTGEGPSLLEECGFHDTKGAAESASRWAQQAGLAKMPGAEGDIYIGKQGARKPSQKRPRSPEPGQYAANEPPRSRARTFEPTFRASFRKLTALEFVAEINEHVKPLLAAFLRIDGTQKREAQDVRDMLKKLPKSIRKAAADTARQELNNAHHGNPRFSFKEATAALTSVVEHISVGEGVGDVSGALILLSRLQNGEIREEEFGEQEDWGRRGEDTVREAAAAASSSSSSAASEHKIPSLDVDGWSFNTSTVGALVIDKHGNIASASSSGGIPLAGDGRVGPAGVPGGCSYACSGYSQQRAEDDDDRRANWASSAAICSGVGEQLLQHQLARTHAECEVRERVATPSSTLLRLHNAPGPWRGRLQFQAGIVSASRVGDSSGQTSLRWAHTTPSFGIAFATNGRVSEAGFPEHHQRVLQEVSGDLRCEVLWSAKAEGEPLGEGNLDIQPQQEK